MIDSSWLTAQPSNLVGMLVSALAIYIALMVCTRLAGLRSFSKMSSFDFAITVAFGSIMASTLLAKSPALITGVAGLVTLFLVQSATAFARRKSYRIERLVGNEPMVLMAGPELLAENLNTARVTVDDIRAKLRQAGVTHRDQVRAVIMESTGDISVLTKASPMEAWLLDHVRDGDKVMERVARAAEHKKD